MYKLSSSNTLKVSLVLCLAHLGVTFVLSEISFNRDIRPILSDKCFQCHGPDEHDREEDLRLDVREGKEGAVTPRDDYFVIKPGDPDKSELWWRLIEEDDDERMPPAKSHKAPLNEEELALFKQWIVEGAEYQDFWAFDPPEKSEPAKIKKKSWNRSFIDNRVMARLESEGLKPKSEADKRTLIRRVTFDLTGLPPTLEEIDLFLEDKGTDAYRNLVDGLLTRPAYGEHMARYWADLVRLSDTNGMHKDFPRDFTTYRDWVIRSFNDNMPYDEFIKYQLAGDLYEEPTRDTLTASGYNRLHLIIDKGTALPEESLHKNTLDQVEAFGTVFLGLTVQCAQCHDHKYDPITQKDYYQLYGFFNNFSSSAETVFMPERGLQEPFINFANLKQEAKLAEFDSLDIHVVDDLKRLGRHRKRSSKWGSTFDKVSVPWIWIDSDAKDLEFKMSLDLEEKPEVAVVRFVGMSKAELIINGISQSTAFSKKGIANYVTDVLQPGENTITVHASGKEGFAFYLDYTEGEKDKVFTSNTDWLVREKGDPNWRAASIVEELDGDNDWTLSANLETIRVVERRLQDISKARKKFLEGVPAAMIMSERDPPRPTRMLIRGAYDAPGELVTRNTPAFLPPMKEKEEIYTRMDLAEWLVSPEHPLTARVAVNRFWQQFFGVGLVKTSEDFGAQGEWPSHQQLLDDLAIEFVKSGWDIKGLIREIVLSKTYKQSSDARSEDFAADPDNRLLARGSRYRMDAEMIRDQILAVSGQLNTSMYGRSVKPPQPPGLWEMVSMAEPKSYIADKDENIYRRSLYSYWRRGMPPPQMTILNAPSREFCVARRDRTNTPLQALLLMNEEEYFKAAKACAASVLAQTEDVDSGLRLVYERITSYEPEPSRLKLLKEALIGFVDLYQNDQNLTEELTADTASRSFEERVELAAWTMVAHSLLNLEFVKVKR